MNAPTIWIITPGIMAVILLVTRRWERLTAAAGVLLALALSGLAWRLPIGEEIVLGPLSMTVGDTLWLLGRRFIITPADGPVLVMIFLSVAFWSGGAVVARVNRLFVPIGMGVAALLTAVLAVQPFLYAAIFILLVVLILVPLLVQIGQPVGSGVIRFITYQTLGTPFILFTGWIMESVEANPGAPIPQTHAGLMLALGFALFLGLFPFHTWMPMLAEQAHPYVVAFVFFVLSLVIPIFGFGLLDTYAGLRLSGGLVPFLQIMGVVMVTTGGVMAAFQRHLARMMGFAMMVQIGFILLAASQSVGPDGIPAMLGIMFMSILPRGVALAVWALGLTSIAVHQPEGIKDRDLLRFRNVQGAGRSLPIASGALLAAHFSMSGLPLLAGFPSRLALWQVLAPQNFLITVAAVLGTMGLLAGGLRAMSVLVMGRQEDAWHISESPSEILLLLAGSILLILIGIFPNIFLQPFTGMVDIFVNLGH